MKNEIYKDAALTLDGETGILASHLNFGQPGRGWDFRSPGRGGVKFEEIIRALKSAGVPVAGADRLKLSSHIVFDDLIAMARFV